MKRPCIYPHCSPDPKRCLRSCTAQPRDGDLIHVGLLLCLLSAAFTCGLFAWWLA